MRPTINSDKHYVHLPVTVVTNGARTNVFILLADNSLAAATSVRVGSVVKAVYVELWVDSATASKTVSACVYKLSDGTSPTFGEMSNMTTYSNKKNVFEFHQGLAPTTGNIIPLFRQWIKIPKGKQRIGLGDSIKISVAATGANMNMCGVFVFKEYY